MPKNLTPDERDATFGPLVVTGQFGRDGVTFQEDPPIVTIPFGPHHQVEVHELAATSLAAVRDDLARDGLLGRVREIYSFQPRLVRTSGGGNKPVLSAHAYGAAVDVNWSDLPQGEHTNAEQAELAPYFEQHGWFWGENFEDPDPHHFAFQGWDPMLDQSAEPPPQTHTPAPRAPAPKRPKKRKGGSLAPVFFWPEPPQLGASYGL